MRFKRILTATFVGSPSGFHLWLSSTPASWGQRVTARMGRPGRGVRGLHADPDVLSPLFCQIPPVPPNPTPAPSPRTAEPAASAEGGQVGQVVDVAVEELVGGGDGV